jgi:DnaJ-class molecular chaperone
MLAHERTLLVALARSEGRAVCGGCDGEGEIARPSFEEPHLVSPRILCQACGGRGVVGEVAS